MSKFSVNPTSRQAIRTHARNIRRSLGVEDKLYFDIGHFVERVMPEVYPEFVFEVCTEAEMGNLHGETIPSEHKIRIREDVYIGACEGRGRDRLTMAHEVGHFFMHDESSVVFCKADPNEKIPHFRDPDWQADVFGGELLAPSYLINGMNVSEIHEICVVSTACADRQLYAIECEKKKGFDIIPV